MEKQYFTLKQLKDLYGISVRGWREHIKRKDLRAYKVGKFYLVKPSDLTKFIEDNEAYSWRKKGAYPFDSDE